jgi:hypothetical protein
MLQNSVQEQLLKYSEICILTTSSMRKYCKTKLVSRSFPLFNIPFTVSNFNHAIEDLFFSEFLKPNKELRLLSQTWFRLFHKNYLFYFFFADFAS